jgi:hypothetical protein
MPTTVQFRRGTSTQNDSFTGSAGEITVDTTNKTIRVHDGSTPGGSRLLTAKFIANTYQTVASANSRLANTNAYIATKLNTTTFNAILANTNNYIATKVNTTTFNSALANTNSSVASQAARITLVNTNLLSTNTALRSYVDTKVSNLVDSAPGALDTLRELATALGNNANFSTTVTNLIGTKISVANTKVYLANTNSFIKAQLANTNAYIATKVNTTTFNSALANTNAWIATKITNSVSTTIQTRNIIPETDVTYNLGSPSRRFKTLYISGNTIAIGATTISASGSSLNVGGETLVSNSYLVATYQTKAVERAALANTNSSIATQAARITLVNTNLLNTNTAIRALDALKISVANAAAIYQTKAVERAALANTNSYIATKVNTTTFNSALANTNIYIATKANATNPTTSGVFAHTGRATISTNLAVTGNTSVGGSLTISGDLTVSGTTTTINSTTVSVADINIELGKTGTPTNATADGGGITLKGTTDKTFNWISATAAWTSSEHINLASTKSVYLNGTDIRATFAANSYVKSVLANTNSYIATQATRINLINTNLTGTNTAIRALDARKLEVANSFSTLTVRSANTAAVTTVASSVKLNDAIVVNPAGHLQIVVNGVTYKVPYFL